ncbi:phosphonate ABC transporter, permease protein PhnE [Leucobacter sp. OLJS4]|nr:phosphonate ABC transporter, permease protein PhnE [Leucobacter sp. OLCALW19]PII87839.1 phosphonate ABC transporter, permease protein PhnE [Leucobacter sp. OLTLW20]PII90514.1 phosphonate ABC transporter, permease protein PhnE [Leucobacter sp. OLAS13]PII97544.1 phosphonate ABC transporter, permease protein PhnE [Leucobacter sp. OLDS2]PIJ01102.1 phosphonate ABC transporter, permease protein PhnE [Leucobacter sp. OLCS4]PIJ02440.1 phosphonate ABC transporter, permease protein PhnE [Leucobacter 
MRSGAGSALPPLPALPARPSRLWPTLWAILVGLVFIVAAGGLKISWAELPALPGQVLQYLELMFASPNWEKLPRALFETWRSISMAWIGAILCVVISIPLGMLAANSVGPLWLRAILRGLFAVIRAVPEVIIALVLLTVTGLTPFTGALALGIAGIGTQGKWVYEAVESVRDGAAEAVRAAGGTTAAVTRWALWPAVAPALLSFALYRFEINIRTSAVLGFVGAGGIGSMLSNYTNYRQWDTVGMLLIVVVIATMIMDAISGAIRRRIMNGRRA